MIFFYNLFVRLYFVAIWVASRWNKKAAAWIKGRKNLFDELEKSVGGGDRIIWMHCASAGEFEQGKPVLEALKTAYPAHQLLVSFFSPSGYTMAKGYKYADYVFYLPLDTQKNAERFITLVKPELVIFVKYEFWYHHLKMIAAHPVPLLLVSAVFRESQAFFKWYGLFFRRILLLYTHIFVQDMPSLHLLKQFGINKVSISGDTRFDRVISLKDAFSEISFIREFGNGENIIVAGSTWEEDESILADYTKAHPAIKILVVPHEINRKRIADLQKKFPDHCLYSDVLKKETIIDQPFTTVANQRSVEKTLTAANKTILQKAQVLIIDSVGLLSRLYQYATLTYVGGGFTKDGIHNILEAAVWGKPVIFGPNYKKYREAIALLAEGGGFSISSTEAFTRQAGHLFNNGAALQAAGERSKKYVEKNGGATQKILKLIQEKRLLTRL